MKAGRKQPKFASASRDSIDLMVFIEGVGEAPYTAIKDHPDPSVAVMYKRAMSGEFGPILPFDGHEQQKEIVVRKELSATELPVKLYMENFIAGLETELSPEEFKKLVRYRNELRAWKPGKELPVRK